MISPVYSLRSFAFALYYICPAFHRWCVDLNFGPVSFDIIHFKSFETQRPLNYTPDAVEYRSRTAEAKTEVDANSKPFATRESRSLNDDGSLSVEEVAISILLKLKIFPFRKAGNDSVVDARTGDMSKDSGVWGAGIDVGLPDGSGFGYSEDASFKAFSFSSVAHIFKWKWLLIFFFSFYLLYILDVE